MKIRLPFIVLVVLFFLVSVVHAANIYIKWDASDGATGYKLYMSIDNGQTWDTGSDVGNVTEVTDFSVPDGQLVLIRVSAYNAQGESIRHDAGVFYNSSWKVPSQPSGAGIE